MVDFEEKMKDIISDYYSTIGKFNNVSNLISLELHEINENDSEEIKREKEGQKREILVDLGRVAEMAFKYLIKIRRMELYPNEPYNDIVINGNVVKGFKDKSTLASGVVKDLGNKVHASKEDINEIINFSSVGPKAHDFSYLYLIIDKLMPDIREKLNEITVLKIKSINSAKVLYEENAEYQEYIAFPNELLKTHNEEDEEQQMIIKLIEKRNQTILYSGDIFTRLRYYSNNPFDKKFDVIEVYNMVSEIIHFIKIVHLCNDKIEFFPEIAFSYSILINYPDLCRFNSDEIRKIYMHPKLQNNPLNIMYCIFVSNLSLDEIFEIVDSKEIKEDDYNIIFSLSLNLETILYFRSIGITRYEEMQRELIKKTSNINEKIFNMVNDERYTLKEYQELIKRFDGEKYPRVLTLLDHLSSESVMELLNQPQLLSFFINEFYVSVNATSYQYNNKLFKALLKVDELKDNPKAWYGVDIDQLEIYSSVSRLLVKDPLNKMIINKRNLSLDTIVENIKENINHFKNNSKMLWVMPLMLDYEDNKAILDILIKNGLNINKLEGFDSTIFCFPLKLVEVIEKVLKFNKIPLILENNINPVVKKIILMISKNHNSNIKINCRRIPRYFDIWQDYKPIIDDSERIEEYFLSTPRGKKIKQYEERIENSNQAKLYNYIMDNIGDNSHYYLEDNRKHK